MFQPGQTVTIITAPAAYPYAPGQTGTVHFAGRDPVDGAPVYSVITTERVAVTSRTRPGGRGSMPVDVYECCGLRDGDLRSAERRVGDDGRTECGDILREPPLPFARRLCGDCATRWSETGGTEPTGCGEVLERA
jgi:hypothetical protein